MFVLAIVAGVWAVIGMAALVAVPVIELASSVRLRHEGR